MESRIKKVLASVLELKESQISDDTSPDTVESWDSLKQMALVVALEEEFEIEFDDDQIGDLLNFKLIKTIVKEIVGTN